MTFESTGNRLFRDLNIHDKPDVVNELEINSIIILRHKTNILTTAGDDLLFSVGRMLFIIRFSERLIYFFF